MGSSASWALALGQVGKGLLEFGQNRETLKYQKERDESLAALQRQQMEETTRHNQASETLAADTLEASTTHNKGLLANSQEQTRLTGQDIANRAEDLKATRAQDRAEADLTAKTEGFKWDSEKKEYVFDQDLFDKSLQRTEAETKARDSAYGGSKGSWQVEVEMTNATLITRRDEGAPELAGKTDAEIMQMAIDSTNLSARKDSGTNRAETIAFLRGNVDSLTKRVEMLALNPKSPEYQTAAKELADAISDWRQAASGGGLMTPPPGSASTAAGSDYRNSLHSANGR